MLDINDILPGNGIQGIRKKVGNRMNEKGTHSLATTSNKQQASNKPHFWRITIVCIITLAVFFSGAYTRPYMADAYHFFRHALFDANNKNSDYQLYSVSEAAFIISGFAFMEGNGDEFCRLKPDTNYSTGIDGHKAQTAGGRVRFSTDSQRIMIKSNLDNRTVVPWSSLYGSLGFDIYVQNNSGEHFIATVAPDNENDYFVDCVIDLKWEGAKDVIIALPQYAGIKGLQIGVEKTAMVTAPMFHYDIENPIVFYGSSITQGSSASRSGKSFAWLVAEHFNADYLNFGFSGAAKGEKEIASLIADVDMSAFVMEYDHNATVEELRATHYEFYKTVRNAHPDISIVMLSRLSGGISITDEEYAERARVIHDTLDKAMGSGDNNVYFINGTELAQGYGNPADLLTDGKHPNDEGMRLIADAIIGCLNGKIQ